MKVFVVLALVAAASAAPQLLNKQIKQSLLGSSWERLDERRDEASVAPAGKMLSSGSWLSHEEHLLAAPEARMMLVKGASAEGRVLKSKAMTKEGGAEIVDMGFDMDEPGRYVYHFKTNNGIAMMEQAALEKDAGKVQGAYEWTSPEGQNYKVEYVADELGYHPVAAHLPVAPEIPVAIQRSLEWNAAHPEEDKEADMYVAKMA